MQKKIILSVVFFLSLTLLPNQAILAGKNVEKKTFLLKTNDISKTEKELTSLGLNIKSNIKEIGILKVESDSETLAGLVNRNVISSFEEDSKIKASYIAPNDPFFPQQNYLISSNIANAWDIAQGNGTIVVAVIDSGINYNHEDLQNKMWKNSAGKYGYDFVNNDDDPMDDYNHGTIVAGVIGAEKNNGKGIAGGANVKLMSVKALNAIGEGEASNLVQGIIYAVNNGAKIINVSLGTPEYSTALDNAVQFATNSGCIIIAAVGNAYKGENPRTPIDNPARNSNVIAVSAVNEFDQRTDYANYGQGISVVALGDNIYSTGYSPTNLKDVYYVGSGTSFATPQVTAAAALLLTKDSTLTPLQIKKRIINSATRINGITGYSTYYGYGELNAYNALTYDKTAPNINASLYNLGGGVFNIAGEAKDDVLGLMGDITTSNIASIRFKVDNGAWSSILSNGSTGTVKVSSNTPVLSSGDHVVTLETTDTSGNIQNKTLNTRDASIAPPSEKLSDYSSMLISQSPYVNTSIGLVSNMNLTFKNTGVSSWNRSKVRLATTRPTDRASIFANQTWASSNRIYMQEDSVPPGGLAHFNFTITAPSGSSGTYNEFFNLVVDGVGWMKDIGLYWKINVEALSYHAEYVGQSAYAVLNKGEERAFWIDYKNSGSVTWDAGNVRL